MTYTETTKSTEVIQMVRIRSPTIKRNPCKIQGFSQVTINKHDNSFHHTNHNIMFTIQKKGELQNGIINSWT